VPYAARFEIAQDVPKLAIRIRIGIDGVLELYGLHRSTYYGWFVARAPAAQGPVLAGSEGKGATRMSYKAVPVDRLHCEI
jgi:hypothetical protein